MKLKFNVLWFDDNVRAINPIKRQLSDLLLDKGFILEVKNEKDNSNVKTIISDINKKKIAVDLILMDYNLTGNDTGDKIIHQIRHDQLFTDILFYSLKANSDVKARISNLDGIYYADRGNLVDKCKKVIIKIIKKVEDLNNMRGLVLAETSELDEKLTQIILKFLKKDDDNKNSLAVQFLVMVQKNYKGRVKDCEKKFKKGIEHFCNDIDPALRYRQVTKFIDNRRSNKDNSFNKFEKDLDLYKNEVLKIRNVLAHVQEERDNKGNKILKSKIKGYEKFTINENSFVQIRKDISKHSENLDNILKVI